MDSSPLNENVYLDVKLARHSVGVGLSAPAIESLSEGAGFAGIEGFGQDAYNELE